MYTPLFPLVTLMFILFTYDSTSGYEKSVFQRAVQDIRNIYIKVFSELYLRNVIMRYFIHTNVTKL